jgi:hypothetical protein
MIVTRGTSHIYIDKHDINLPRKQAMLYTYEAATTRPMLITKQAIMAANHSFACVFVFCVILSPYYYGEEA